MGYHHVPIREEERAKTAFSTRRGLFQFNTMPFGVTNASATFQRLIEKVLNKMNSGECLVYSDDVLVWSATFTWQSNKLERIFAAFRAAGLRFKRSQCQIVRREVKYLCHVIGTNGLSMEHDRIKGIRDIAVPKHKTELQSLLCLGNIYRRYLRSPSEVEAP